MLESRPITPIRDGWLEVRVPENVMQDLWGMIDVASVDAREKLAGNISSSLNLDASDTFRSFIAEATEDYQRNFNYNPVS